MGGHEGQILRGNLVVVSIVKDESAHLKEFITNIRSLTPVNLVLEWGSADESDQIAEDMGAIVVKHQFIDFGKQWNAAVKFAEEIFPDANFFLKLDPDERLTTELIDEITKAIDNFSDRPFAGLIIRRRLWFMGQPLPIFNWVPRLWVRGRGKFSKNSVNEQLIVDGLQLRIEGNLEHLDSPSLEHWLDKQNKYGSSEARDYFRGSYNFSKRKLVINKFVYNLPFFSLAVFVYYFFIRRLFLAGRVGFIYSVCRGDVYKYRKFKMEEIRAREVK